jgi:hypothetical protein
VVNAGVLRRALVEGQGSAASPGMENTPPPNHPKGRTANGFRHRTSDARGLLENRQARGGCWLQHRLVL